MDLEEQVLHYKANYDVPPNSFSVNTQLTHLIIPVKNGLPHLVKWIHMLDSGKVTCHTSTDSPNDDSAILDVYTTPTLAIADPLWPLFTWVCHALWGPTTGYEALLQAITELQDPALCCKIEWYHALNAKVQLAQIQHKEDLANLEGLKKACHLCEEWLIHTCLPEKVEYLESHTEKGYPPVIAPAWKKAFCKVDTWGHGHPL